MWGWHYFVHTSDQEKLKYVNILKLLYTRNKNNTINKIVIIITIVLFFYYYYKYVHFLLSIPNDNDENPKIRKIDLDMTYIDIDQ